MYIQVVEDIWFTTPAPLIKLEYTNTKLILKADIRDLYHSNVSNPPLLDEEYLMMWEVRFDDLVKNAEATGDDEWLFLYPKAPLYNTNAPAIIHLKTDPTDWNIPLCVASIMIRPHTTSFDNAQLTIHLGKNAKFEVNGKPFIKKDYLTEFTWKRIKLLGTYPNYKLVWEGAKRDVDLYIKPSMGRVEPNPVRLEKGQASFKLIPPRQWDLITLNITSTHLQVKNIDIRK